MGQAFPDKQALCFDLSNGNSSDRFTFHQWGTIKTCTTLPGPHNYNLEQCAVVINEVIYEKLRFFVYDERFDELIEIYQTTSNVQVIYRKICALLTRTQPQNLHKSLKDVLGCKIKGMSRSYLLNNIKNDSNKIMNQSLLCCGDMIARRMDHDNTTPWHYGVYFDDNKVYHWCSQKSNNNKSKCRFSRTSLAVFMGDKQQLFVEYDIIQIYSNVSKEGRAISLLQTVYNLWNNNCEHLANEICRGKGKCDQKLLGIGSIMGPDLSLTRMLFNALGGSSKKNTIKCVDCKGWNYNERECDVNKACDKCKKKWDDYQYEMRQRLEASKREQMQRNMEYNARTWDEYRSSMDRLDTNYNSLSNYNTMPSFNSSLY